MSNVPNWHRWLYGALAALLTVLVLIQTGVIPILSALPSTWTWAPLVLVVVIAFLKDFLPRIQTQTGPGAPPILSPPLAPPLRDPPLARDAVLVFPRAAGVPPPTSADPGEIPAIGSNPP